MAHRSSASLGRCQSALCAVLLFFGFAAAVIPSTSAVAESQLPGYAEAEDAFMHLTLDERAKLQILLTAAGYWPAVPDADFSTRLFNAILRFEVDNGFAPLGILNEQQMDRLAATAAPYLNAWRFEMIRHPSTNTAIWVPVGLPVVEERTPTGLNFVNGELGVLLSYDYYPAFNLRASFGSLRDKLMREGTRIYYSKLYRDEFFVISFSDGITDAYARYHQAGGGGVGFTLSWNHAGTEAHIERIATLISGSLWSSMTGAPFTTPFTIGGGAPAVATSTGPTPAPAPVPSAPEPRQSHVGSSGTGIFVTGDGHVLTNAHVVKDCMEIRIRTGQGEFESGRLVAKDPTNDLALLDVNAKPTRVAALRFGVRLGENVYAFGYPLSDVLASSGNFTLGNVTALAGLMDDSRFYQISAPIQPGNSGGPLLDENGNLIGIVSSKLNFLSEIRGAGDIPQNVNFAIKANVAANFLQDNNIKFQIGEATQPMKAPDLADEAKALSAYVECQ